MANNDGIVCLKVSKKFFGPLTPNGDNVVFVFTDEEKANIFLEECKHYLPDLPFVVLPYNTIKELKSFVLQNMLYIYVDPIFEIAFNHDNIDSDGTFHLKIKENTQQEKEEVCEK